MMETMQMPTVNDPSPDESVREGGAATPTSMMETMQLPAPSPEELQAAGEQLGASDEGNAGGVRSPSGGVPGRRRTTRRVTAADVKKFRERLRSLESQGRDPDKKDE